MATELFSLGQTILEDLLYRFHPDSDVVIPYTENEIALLCERNGIHYPDVIKDFCRYFSTNTYQIGDFEKNLAVCAIQVALTYNCISHGDRSYNEELASTLKTTLNQLEAIYSNLVRSNQRNQSLFLPFQEVLWNSVRDNLEKKRLKLIIPKQTTGPGRYVQYPRSQQLFSLSKYNEYEKRFQRLKIKHNQTYSFSEFCGQVFNKGERCYSGGLFFGFSQVLETIARNAIFYCFCNYVERQHHKMSPNKVSDFKKTKDVSGKHTIKLNVEENSFLLFSPNGKRIVPPFNNQQPMVFEYDNAYDEWIEARRITPDSTVGIIGEFYQVQKYSDSPEYERLYESGVQFHVGNYSFVVFPTGSDCSKALPFISTQKKAFTFAGGLKDENGNWVSGFLPTVVFPNGISSLFLDSMKIENQNGILDLNQCDLSEGEHVLKFPEYSPVYIEIANTLEKSCFDGGWKWSRNLVDFSFVESGWYLCGLVSAAEEKAAGNHSLNLKIDNLNNRFTGKVLNAKIDMIYNRFEKKRGGG